MLILSIDTSCDETSVAVTKGRRILANERYSQILIHKKWGGVVPHLAKRAHEERIDLVVSEALKKFSRWQPLGLPSREDVLATPGVDEIDFVAVTYGPGLAPALEVGINKAKEIARTYGKKLIAVDHMEGHIYSCFAQNRNGNPKHEFKFPYLALLVSGAHTELVLFKDHITYEIIGETVDDAVGESLDKSARLLGFGYPGGPAIERLAKEGNPQAFELPRPMHKSDDLNYSFSGLKTAFYYLLKEMREEESAKSLADLAASYQEAAFDSLLIKLDRAIEETGVKNILVAGGVAANMCLRKRVRALVKRHGGQALSPPFKGLYGDNAAMIGIAAYFKAQKGMFVKDLNKLDRVPRARLSQQERE